MSLSTLLFVVNWTHAQVDQLEVVPVTLEVLVILTKRKAIPREVIPGEEVDGLWLLNLNPKE